MNKWLTSAPGKLVIAGEYAVLEGYPSIVTAVNQRAYVSSESATNWQMQTQSRAFIDIPYPAAEFELINQVLNAAQNQKNLSQPKKLKIDSSALYYQGKGEICKLGLGSSAAVTTCLAAQCLDSIFFDRDAIFTLSFKAHKAFMHQAGSGIDIAASCYGGILSFQLSPENVLPSINPLNIVIDPNCMIGVFTKKAQDTRMFLKAVFQLKKNCPREYYAIMKNLGEQAKALEIPLCLQPDWYQLTKLTNCILASLQELGKKASINIVTDKHQYLAKIANQYGGAAKPSGAGGGDMALCFIPMERKINFLQKLKQLDLEYLPLDFLASGVDIINI
jgi:phosphomevalonate kinase